MQHEEPAAPVKQGDIIAPFSGNDLPGCCSGGRCGYLDEQFAAMGCIDASVFGDTGDGC